MQNLPHVSMEFIIQVLTQDGAPEEFIENIMAALEDLDDGSDEFTVFVHEESTEEHGNVLISATGNIQVGQQLEGIALGLPDHVAEQLAGTPPSNQLKH